MQLPYCKGSHYTQFSLYLIGPISFTKIHKESAHLPCLSFAF